MEDQIWRGILYLYFKHVLYNVHNSPGALLFPEVVICPGSDGEWRSRSQSQGHDSRARILAQNRHAWAQAERMKEYDTKHPERIKKISENNRKAWAICPEIKAKLAEFTKNESDYVKNILRKKVEGKKLTEQEKSIHKNYYKRFWQTYPELKKVFADAKRNVKKSND